MKVYIDSDFHCHTGNPDGLFREVEDPFFDGKCDTFIEGYCYKTDGEMTSIYPWKPSDELEEAQREYERQLLAEYESLIDELYTEVTT